MPPTTTSRKEIEELLGDLKSRLEGDVRWDDVTRLLYSTDASLYQIEPLGVVLPRHAGDVIETVRLAHQHGIPLLPRGGGTSLAGQAVGKALVLDFSRHMHGVLEVNAEERWARVQPGVVLDELNAELADAGLQFAPDVATSSRATLGGMMGNNSAGAHSLIYGKTVDHVIEQNVVLSDGSEAAFRELSADAWRQRGEGAGLEAQIYRELWRITQDNAAEIDARFPRLMRRVGGYNLDEFVRRQRYNAACITVGSEGTLATVTEARINLVPLPTHKAVLVVHFHDLIEALETAPICLEYQPSAVELTDRMILDLTKTNPSLSRARTFLQGDPEAILVVEFYGDSDQAALDSMSALEDRLGKEKLGYACVRRTHPAEQSDVWKVRKSGLGLLMGMKGEGKPIAFIEDTSVPPEDLADYIRRVRDLLKSYSIDSAYYAHASVGVIHIRPVMNMKSARQAEEMREILGAVSEIVQEYGGALSAEHGDGLVRSEFQERMFGPTVYRAFQDVKRAFDPQGIMNPGKIVDAAPNTENLRYSSGYQTIPVETVLDFSADGGYAAHVELCSGVGDCRKKRDGSMCPSYRATLEEEHSTRGRANILRAVLSGELGDGHLADHRAMEALDLCLECKACKSECPSNVDMAKLKYEFLAQYYARHGTPLRSRLFAYVADASRRVRPFAGLVNWTNRQPWARALMERAVGITAQGPLPTFAQQTLSQWFARHEPAAGAGQAGETLLWPDTFTQYNEPEVGQAAVEVLETMGYGVRLPEVRCCGRPMISKGFLRQARENARFNVERLAPLVREGLPVVVLEPSCLSTLRDEYREFGLGQDAVALADSSLSLEEFVAARSEGQPARASLGRRCRLHGHCHQKALWGTEATMAALAGVGWEVDEIPSGCCGMAGSFGYEKEHYELSLQIGELSLFSQVRETDEETVIVAPGTSCRHQIARATGREAVHPAVALAQALRDGPTLDSLRELLGSATPEIPLSPAERDSLATAIQALFADRPHPTLEDVSRALPEGWATHPRRDELIAAVMVASGERTA